ncbi:MAG: DUF4198 domain-containing protein [Saprospiraceae bacterium]
MKKFVCFLVLIGIVVSVQGHEYILLPYKFRLEKGDNLEVHLFSADGFNVQLERPIQKEIIKKFELITRDSTIDLSLQENGTLPVIDRTVNFNGGGLIHMERDYARITLATDKFLAYLDEDHIDGIKQLMDKTKREQKERYTRYIKTLVQNGSLYSDTLFKQNIHQKFEIVLLQNPYLLHKGSLIKARILFNGKPLAGKTMTARNRIGSEPASVFTSKTDSKGICSFLLTRTGDWFIHGTYMIACEDKSDSDWESFWTSYSFGID